MSKSEPRITFALHQLDVALRELDEVAQDRVAPDQMHGVFARVRAYVRDARGCIEAELERARPLGDVAGVVADLVKP